MKKMISLIALLLSVVLMATPAFAAEAPAPEGSPEITAETPADAATTAVTTSAALPETETEAAAPVDSEADAPVNEEAKALYDRAVAKMDAASSIEMNGSMKMTLTAGEETASTLMGLTTRQMLKDGKTEMEVLMYSPEFGVMDEIHYKDGYLYNKIADLKTKTKMNLDDLEAMSYDLNKELTADMFASASMEKLENGNTRIVTTIGADVMNEVTSEAIQGMFAQMDLGEAAYEISDIKYSMELDSAANLVNYRMDYSATITVEGETVVAGYAAVFKVKSINQLVAIAYPDDLDTYVEA